MKITILDRILLLLTCLLAAWQVAIGIKSAETLPLITYTIGFGVLLVAGLLLIILGFDVLDSPAVVIISTIIPLLQGFLSNIYNHWVLDNPYYSDYPNEKQTTSYHTGQCSWHSRGDDFPASGHPGYFWIGTPYFRLGRLGRSIDQYGRAVDVFSSNGKTTSFPQHHSQGSSRFAVPYDSLFCDRF
jgi:hypothetical protein